MLNRLLTALFLFVTCLPTQAQPQDLTRAILVLDASGSMWGQIDGTAKITIAQQVIGELLQSLPPEQELGLTAYGHRRKGDCSDIETLILPGGDQRAAIADTVNAIKPKGKTPLSAAVIQAAEALKYTEEAATVILISDGKETCDFDPCEVGRKLEETGVDFTAHVIGFDIANPADRAELQCLAEETGGTFRTASNAAELGQALEVVAEAPPPPMPVEIALEARITGTGALISSPLLWSVTGADGTVHLPDTMQVGATLTLLPGTYTAQALRPEDEALATREFSVAKQGKRVILTLPEFLPQATLNAPTEAPAGSTVMVAWTGPNAQNDYISSHRPKGKQHISYTYTREGTPLELQMPPEPGLYEIHYTLADGRRPLASVEINVTPVEATLSPPAVLPAGSTVAVGWTGPDYRDDYLAISRKGQEGQETYAYTREGTPLDLQLPAEPGAYELRYVMAQGRTVVASMPVTVTPVSASVSAPADLPAGGTVQIAWDGPNDKNDYIAVFPKGSDRYSSYAYTLHGSPLTLTLPAEPGEYDLAYVQSQGRTVIASVPITVTSVTASVTPPAAMPAGATVQVAWDGPNQKNDYIAIFPKGSDRYTAYAYTRHGSPLELAMPAEPGEYDLAYVQSQGRTVLASVPVTVTAVSATLSPPASLPAGGTVQIAWDGPNDKNDYIAIFPRGSDRYQGYTYTRHGSPLSLQLPATPGVYDLAYVQNVGNKKLTVVPVTVSPVTANLTVPGTLEAGGQAVIAWDGPNDKNDYIAIFPRGSDRYQGYTYTREGTPLSLTLPGTPGEYDIAYVQDAGNSVLSRVPVTLTPATATITPTSDPVAGGNLSLTWTGPNNKDDYIAIMPRDGTKYQSYTYTREGSPLIIQLPETPGEYDITYVLDSDQVVIARVPISVK